MEIYTDEKNLTDKSRSALAEEEKRQRLIDSLGELAILGFLVLMALVLLIIAAITTFRIANEDATAATGANIVDYLKPSKLFWSWSSTNSTIITIVHNKTTLVSPSNHSATNTSSQEQHITHHRLPRFTNQSQAEAYR